MRYTAPAGAKMKRRKLMMGTLAFAVLVSSAFERGMRGCCVFLFRLRGPVLIPVAGGWQASLAAANLLWIHKVAVERQLEEARRKSKEATAQLKVIRDMLESSQTQQEAEHKQVQALTSAFTDKGPAPTQRRHTTAPRLRPRAPLLARA